MDDDFENDIDLADDNLDDSLGDLGDLGVGDAAEGDSETLDDSSEAGGTRSSGGARANARLTQSEPASVRAPRPPTPKAPKAATKAPMRAKTPAPVKAKAKAKAKPAKKAAKKKAAPKKKAKSAAKKKSKPARKAGKKK
jgi:hypothetical protein